MHLLPSAAFWATEMPAGSDVLSVPVTPSDLPVTATSDLVAGMSGTDDYKELACCAVVARCGGVATNNACTPGPRAIFISRSFGLLPMLSSRDELAVSETQYAVYTSDLRRIRIRNYLGKTVGLSTFNLLSLFFGIQPFPHASIDMMLFQH